MYCNKCGTKFNSSDNFCQNCGNDLRPLKENNEAIFSDDTNNDIKFDNNQINNTITEQPNSNSNQINNKVKFPTNIHEKISLIIGIFSVLFAYIFEILIIPLAVIGLWFGFKGRKSTNKFNFGILLNLLVIIITFFTFINNAFSFFNDSDIDDNNTNNNETSNNEQDNDDNDTYTDRNKEYFVGTWNCASPANPKNYTFVVTLNNNRTYYAGQYGDLANNHATGEYQLRYNDKFLTTRDDYMLFWFYLDFITTDEYIYNGVSQNEPYNAKFELGRFVGDGYTGKYITLYSTNGINSYICEKES